MNPFRSIAARGIATRDDGLAEYIAAVRNAAPPDHRASNSRVTGETLLDRTRIPVAPVHRIREKQAPKRTTARVIVDGPQLPSRHAHAPEGTCA
jgi:hypothetical protein